MEVTANGKISLEESIPENLREAINKLIDEKVE